MAIKPCRARAWSSLLLLASTLHPSCSWRPASPLPRRAYHYSRASPLCMQASSSSSSSRPPSNLLAQVRRHSLVIADTADYQQLEYLPDVREVTTNPSIIWQAAQKEEYFHLLEEACNMYLHLQKEGIPDMIEAVPPKFAREIFKRLPRASSSSSSLPSSSLPSSPIPRVYIQLDPRFVFNEDLAIKKVLYLVHLCVEKHDIPLDNLVIKIPGSWEGIQAARRLEEGGGEGGREGGVRCLVTAVTSIVQAKAAAEAGVSYVAPYVGRVSDWKGEEGGREEGEEGGVERGVGLARDMQILFRMRGWGKTKVMAASLRGQEQIKALTGCDILTISPKVMIELECADPVEEEGEEGRKGGLRSFVPEVPTWEDLTLRSRRLLGGEGGREGGAKMTEVEFREALQRDACGTAVFAKSMKLFVEDLRALEKVFFDYLDDRRKRRR